jgi:hypothetical protein
MHSRWSLANRLASHFPMLRSGQQARPKYYHRIPLEAEPDVFFHEERVPSLPARQLIWIGPAELAELVSTSRDLVVIDLRAGAQWRPFPVPGAFVLPVAPYRLAEVLERLPSDRSLILYGASPSLGALRAVNSWMRGSAPLYLAEDSYAPREHA